MTEGSRRSPQSSAIDPARGEQPDFRGRTWPWGQSLSLSGAWQENARCFFSQLWISGKKHRHERFGHTGNTGLSGVMGISHMPTPFMALSTRRWITPKKAAGSHLKTGPPAGPCFSPTTDAERSCLFSGQFEQATTLFRKRLRGRQHRGGRRPHFQNMVCLRSGPGLSGQWSTRGRCGCACGFSTRMPNAWKLKTVLGPGLSCEKAELALVEGHPDAATTLAEEALTIARRARRPVTGKRLL